MLAITLFAMATGCFMFVIAFVLLTTYLTQLESNKLFLKPEWRTQKKMSI